MKWTIVVHVVRIHLQLHFDVFFANAALNCSFRFPLAKKGQSGDPASRYDGLKARLMPLNGARSHYNCA